MAIETITDCVKGKFQIFFDNKTSTVDTITNFMITTGGDMLVLISESGNVYNFKNITYMKRVFE